VHRWRCSRKTRLLKPAERAIRFLILIPDLRVFGSRQALRFTELFLLPNKFLDPTIGWKKTKSVWLPLNPIFEIGLSRALIRCGRMVTQGSFLFSSHSHCSNAI
jgi:hypothetical protein